MKPLHNVKLYSQLLNPFTEKVACALALKGVHYQRLKVSGSDEVKQLSPDKQILPVLEVDGKQVSGSGDIIRWIEELYPEPSLYAADPKTRHQQESLADWSDTSFAFYWNRWLTAVEENERNRLASSGGILSRIHQHVDRQLGIGQDDEMASLASVRNIMDELGHRMDDLVGFLGNRPYFFADQLSVADLAVFGMLLVIRDGPMPRSIALLADRPTLAAHTARLSKLTQQGIGERDSQSDD
ncbi:MAG: glutathione S-transferase family protein [bacterium]|jgi:glutathione S-transferase